MINSDSRAYRWYALTTAPQKELAVQKILDRDGFATFVATKTEFRYVNRTARVQRRKVERTYPLMARYVFVGMNEGTPGWGRISAFMHSVGDARGRAITGVIGQNGKPSPIPHDPLRDLMVRHASGRFNAPGYQRWMETRREFGVGDRVLTDIEGIEGKVIEITDAKARVLMEFLGASREVHIPLEKLAAAE